MKKLFHAHKKSHIFISALLLLFAALICACLTIFFMARSKYWASPHLENAVMKSEEYSKYSSLISDNDSSTGQTEAEVHRCNEAAKPVNPLLSPFFDHCNEMIISYFKDVYETDVTEKLSALHVMESVYPPDISQTVGGSHSADFPKKVFINADIVSDVLNNAENGEFQPVSGNSFDSKLLRSVYIHEVIHYLGFNSSLGFDNFTEAMAEYLHGEITLQAGIKFESITGYADILDFAAQAVECDPGLIKGVLNESGFDMHAYFNGKFSGSASIDYAEYYDNLIGLVQHGGFDDLGKIKYYTQYLTYEYCKISNSGADEILAASKHGGVNMFEVKWLLGIYR